ncbi:MAG: helix-turn-helix transcriptional regulator [Nitrospirae bacterium]|nr:helix-turn-helix transcriptional regulator [Nitrospirota bacterium]
MKHSLTQDGLAGLLGVTKACISRWESGNRPISPFLHLALECLKVKRGGDGKDKERRYYQRSKGRKGKKRKEVR